MKTARILFLFAGLFLAACQTATVANYDAQLDTWIGRPVDVLVSSWGVPDKQYDADRNTRLVAYIRNSQVIYPSSCSMSFGVIGSGYGVNKCVGGYAPQGQSLRCETTFTVVKGKITDVRHRGNDCRA